MWPVIITTLSYSDFLAHKVSIHCVFLVYNGLCEWASPFLTVSQIIKVLRLSDAVVIRLWTEMHGEAAYNLKIN